MKQKEQTYSVVMLGGPSNGHVISGLIADVEIPNYVATGEFDLLLRRVFRYNDPEKLPTIFK